MSRGYRVEAGQSSVEPIRDEVDLRNFISCFKKARDAEPDPRRAAMYDRDWMMVLLGVNAALRFSDLRRLTADKVRYNCISQRDQKTGKENRFSLNPAIYREVRAYMDRNGLSGNDYLFRSAKGVNRPLSRQQGYNIIQEAKRLCGIRYPIGTHTLRKTYGYWFYRETGDIVALQAILNHSSPAVTLVYIGMRKAEVDEKRSRFVIR